jgi:hypothetical protein
MTEIDLDRLGDVWRAQPDPAEIEQLRHAAEAVRRRARWGQLADFWLAMLVSGVILALVIVNPQLKTALVGGFIILYLLYSTVRQRRLRAIELTALTGSTERMLDQSIERAEAAAKRSRLSLIMSGPALLLGLGFAAALDRGTGQSPLQKLNTIPWVGTIAVPALVIALAVAALYVLRTNINSRREIERLKSLRDAYQAENAGF